MRTLSGWGRDGGENSGSWGIQITFAYLSGSRSDIDPTSGPDLRQPCRVKCCQWRVNCMFGAALARPLYTWLEAAEKIKNMRRVYIAAELRQRLAKGRPVENGAELAGQGEHERLVFVAGLWIYSSVIYSTLDGSKGDGALSMRARDSARKRRATERCRVQTQCWCAANSEWGGGKGTQCCANQLCDGEREDEVP